MGLALLSSDLGAAPRWGRLANPGFDGQRIKTTLFFAGQANDGTSSCGCTIGFNRTTYTLTPVPEDLHLKWLPQNTDRVVDMMVDAGINVISMSSWGEDFLPCTDGWITGAAPMQTSPCAHNDLFVAAAKKHILITPFIESRSTWTMRDEFPIWPDGRVSPGLVSQILNLVQRYLKNPAHSEWAKVWTQVYDPFGTPRFAIVLIHAASNNLQRQQDETFAMGLNLVAHEVEKQTGIKVGFFLDATPSNGNLDRASFKPSARTSAAVLAQTRTFLGIQCFIPELFTSEKGNDDLLAWKRAFIHGWFSRGIPVLVDVSPGYDGHLVFSDPHGAYGYSEEWIQGLTALVDDYGRAGMVYNSWNGYTEGMAATPTKEKGNAYYDWLKRLNARQAVHVDRNAGGPGAGTVSEPFPTLTQGVVEASDGDTVSIHAGHYTEPLTFSKAITLVAETGVVTVGTP